MRFVMLLCVFKNKNMKPTNMNTPGSLKTTFYAIFQHFKKIDFLKRPSF